MRSLSCSLSGTSLNGNSGCRPGMRRPLRMESRTLRLLDDLFAHPDPEVAEFAKNEKARLLQAIAASKEIRPPVYMEPDERFE
jgi:hypothetical protein